MTENKHPPIANPKPCEYYQTFPDAADPKKVCTGIAYHLTMLLKKGGAELLPLCEPHRTVVRKKNASFFYASRRAGKKESL